MQNGISSSGVKQDCLLSHLRYTSLSFHKNLTMNSSSTGLLLPADYIPSPFLSLAVGSLDSG